MAGWDDKYGEYTPSPRARARWAYYDRLIEKGCTERKASRVAWRKYP